MKKLHYILFVVLCGCIALSACRKEAPELYDPNQEGLCINSWGKTFESFWHGMNNNYVFWDVDTVDWDRIYAVYKPKFDAIEGQSEAADKQAEAYFMEFIPYLRDHHFNLTLNLNGTRFNPGDLEVLTRDYYHDRFSYEAFMGTVQKLREAGRITAYKEAEVACPHTAKDTMRMISYNLDQGIVYLQFDGFSISHLCQEEHQAGDEDHAALTEVYQNYRNLIESLPNLKGVVIDVRQNGGGYYELGEDILGILISEPLTFAEQRTKNGMGRLDFAPWIPTTLHVHPDNHPVTVPIIALADLYSVSMSEMTSMAISEMPNGYVIGERTFGGHGGVINRNYSYVGTFGNQVYEVYTCSVMTRRMDGKCYEGIGVIPDIECHNDSTRFAAGIDDQLERAVTFIKTGR
ncbi:MAG: S41 family peptidase [Alistipes sp.]|nr:S41 family peptidase [Alistipes sp.]